MVAWIFCDLTLIAQKRPPAAYPKVLETVGDHIRKARLDRGLSQPELARIMNITVASLTNWEVHHKIPTVNMWPRIISFLGYYPEEDDGSLRFQLVKYRRSTGLRRTEAAELIGIDEQTLGRIENEAGKNPPFAKTVKKIEEFIRGQYISL